MLLNSRSKHRSLPSLKFLFPIASALFALPALGATVNFGNLVVTVNEFTGSSTPPRYVGEYTTTGTRLQVLSNVPIPGGGAGPSDQQARDLIFDPVNNAVHLYNGTFTPSLAHLNVATQTWTQESFAGWSTVNNSSYGGIAQLGSGIYVSDMETFGPGQQPKGIVRFDLLGAPTVRFSTTIQPKDLTIGLDGILYALDGASSPTSTVYKFDPLTGLSLGTVPIEFDDNRAVAAAADGSIFVATWGGAIRQYSATGGAPLASLTVQNTRFSDVDLTPTGGVALGTADGDVVLTTTALGSFTKFRATDSTLGGTTFVAWVVPEPATLPLLLSAAALLAGVRRRRSVCSNLEQDPSA